MKTIYTFFKQFGLKKRPCNFPDYILSKLHPTKIGKYNYYTDEELNYLKQYLDKEPIEKQILTNQLKYGGNAPACSKEIIKKIKQTSLERFGKESYLATEECRTKRKNTPTDFSKIKQTTLDKYGVECVLQLPEVRDKLVEANRIIYGTDYPFQNPEYRPVEHISFNYLFEGIYFDSSWEMCYYFYLKYHNIDFTYQPKIYIPYFDGKKNRKYYPDFIVGDRLVELKGNQFFTNGDMICPYDHSQDYIFSAKYKCILDNNVIIYTEKDLKEIIQFFVKINGNVKKYKTILKS